MRLLAGIARVLPSRHEEGIHTRLARADRLLLDAADRADRAVQEDLARRGDLVAVDDVRARAAAAPRARRRGPPTGRRRRRRRSMTRNGRWMSQRVLDDDADDRRAASLPARRSTVRIRSTSVCLPRRTVMRHAWPILPRDIAVVTSAGLRTRLPSIATITSSGSSLPSAGKPAPTWSIERAGRAQSRLACPRARSATAAATCCECCMSCRSTAPSLRVADAGRIDVARRVQVGALVQAAEELLEHRRLADDHVDEVDAALGRVVPAATRSRAARPGAPCRAGRCTRWTGRRRAPARRQTGRPPATRSRPGVTRFTGARGSCRRRRGRSCR